MREVFGALALSFRTMELPAEDEDEEAAYSADGSAQHPLGAAVGAREWVPAPAPEEIGKAIV